MQSVFDICKSKINFDKLFENVIISKTVCTNVLFLDGTSCTKKTTILRKTNTRVYKVQKYNYIKNPNTFPPSAVGYVFSGLFDLVNLKNNEEIKFADRSILNNLEWSELWKLMDKFYFEEKFVDFDYKDIERVDKIVFDYFQNFINWPSYLWLRKKIVGLAIVDSDVFRCNDLRIKRIESKSDVVRSNWPFYTVLQNSMYKLLYNECFLDLLDFNEFNDDDVTSGVALFLAYTQEKLKNLTKNYLNPSILILNIKLPTFLEKNKDLTLYNLNSWVYRNKIKNEISKVKKKYYPYYNRNKVSKEIVDLNFLKNVL